MKHEAAADEKSPPTAVIPFNSDYYKRTRSNSFLTLSSTIEADPQFYSYHAKSTLALGRTFNHADVTRPMRNGLTATEVSLDGGSPASLFSLYYVTSEDQLDIALSLDSKAEASYLGVKAGGHSTFSAGFKIKSSSVVVVARIYKDYGRFALKNDVALTQDAANMLVDPKQFVNTFGDRYVAIERRGASASVIISIDSVATDLKLDFKNEFSAKGGWGKLTAEAQQKFELIFTQATKQSRVSVEAMATGADDFEGLIKTIKGIKDVPSAVGAIEEALSTFVAQFTPDKAVPIEYNVAPLTQFGLNEALLDPWTDQKERELSRMVRDYRMAIDLLDAIPAFRDGTHLFQRLWHDNRNKDFIELAINSESILQATVAGIATNHQSLKEGKDLQIVQYPAIMYTYAQLMEEALRPPYMSIEGLLTDAQVRAVLRAKRGERHQLAVTFNPELAIGVALTMGVQAVYYELLTAQEFARYEDGSTKLFPEFKYDGRGAGAWYVEPNKHNDINMEDSWVQWFAKHNGKFNVTVGWIVRDVAERLYEISIMEAKFEVRNETFISLELKNLF